MMTITYEVGDGLYVNLTNRCPNACTFCIRRNGAGAYGSDSLWLDREPTEEEVVADIEKTQLGSSLMTLEITVLLPAPDGPDTTISRPCSLMLRLTSGIRLIFSAHSARHGFRLNGGKDHMTAVHNENRSGASAIGGVNELSPVTNLLNDALYRR